MGRPKARSMHWARLRAPLQHPALCDFLVRALCIVRGLCTQFCIVRSIVRPIAGGKDDSPDMHTFFIFNFFFIFFSIYITNFFTSFYTFHSTLFPISNFTLLCLLAIFKNDFKTTLIDQYPTN